MADLLKILFNGSFLVLTYMVMAIFALIFGTVWGLYKIHNMFHSKQKELDMKHLQGYY